MCPSKHVNILYCLIIHTCNSENNKRLNGLKKDHVKGIRKMLKTKINNKNPINKSSLILQWAALIGEPIQIWMEQKLRIRTNYFIFKTKQSEELGLCMGTQAVHSGHQCLYSDVDPVWKRELLDSHSLIMHVTNYQKIGTWDSSSHCKGATVGQNWDRCEPGWDTITAPTHPLCLSCHINWHWSH